MKQNTLIIGLLISLVIVPAATFSLASYLGNKNSATLTAAPPIRSQADIKASIVRGIPSLANSQGEAQFTITSYRRLSNNWYVAWIDDNVVKLLINDPSIGSQYMRVLLGPASVFDQSIARQKGVPDQIFQEFIDAKL